MRPRFQTRHYRVLAAALKAARARPNDSAQEAIADLIEDLAAEFQRDNPKFKADTFRRAVGVQQ